MLAVFGFNCGNSVTSCMNVVSTNCHFEKKISRPIIDYMKRIINCLLGPDSMSSPLVSVADCQ